MRKQTLHLGNVVLEYRLGETWFDGALRVSDASTQGAPSVDIEGTDTVMALRDFLNSLDFSGRRLTVVKSPG